MTTRDRIRFMSSLPARFNGMLEHALKAVADPSQQEELCVVACLVANAAWKFWHSQRPPEDNRQEHEFVVFANVMNIAESEQLSLSDKRVAVAFTFIHDSFFIPRIMEQSIIDATEEVKKKLEEQKKEQRILHMNGGAKNAEFLLGQLTRPDSPADLLFSRDEIKRCADIVRTHDMWKLARETPPPTADKLALACLEGDALWPLHPLGVLADLERPDKRGDTKDFSDPNAWRIQVEQSLVTLTNAFRPAWGHIPAGDFKDADSIFRTKQGFDLYTGWRKLWNV